MLRYTLNTHCSTKETTNNRCISVCISTCCQSYTHSFLKFSTEPKVPEGMCECNFSPTTTTRTSIWEIRVTECQLQPHIRFGCTLCFNFLLPGKIRHHWKSKQPLRSHRQHLHDQVCGCCA